jgi:hypothetical protein
MDATYKFGWKTFSCPACGNASQEVPAAIRTPRADLALGRIAPAMVEGAALACSACSVALTLRLDPASRVFHRPSPAPVPPTTP